MKEQNHIETPRRTPEMMLLANELSRMFHCEMRKVCEENGVPVGYRSLLFHLARHNGCSQRDLAEMTGLKASTVSIAMDKMERDGYITREKNCNDSRAVRVFLTEKGIDIDRKNKEKIGKLEKLFADTVSDGERDMLTTLLEKVIRGYCGMQGYALPAFLAKSGAPGEKSGQCEAGDTLRTDETTERKNI